MERRRTFSREFKIEAVKIVVERGVSVAQAAKDLGVHENVLRKWVRELRQEPQEAFLLICVSLPLPNILKTMYDINLEI